VVHLSLLSLDDGKGDIVRAARRIAERVRTNDLDPADVDESVVGGSLSTNAGMPDPDLLVRVGPVESNLGFLPWQIRLTEIHSLETHLGVQFADLLKILKDYSKCEQRFGK
jgi:dehydrodolichyl diphosphate syntase complex subunit NUS1